MRTVQHLIKAFAIALAVLIIVTIFGAVVGGVTFLGALTTDDWEWDGPHNDSWTEENYDGVKLTNLDISVKATAVKVRTVEDGERVRIETNNDHIVSWTDEDAKRLNVVEKSHGVFGWGGTGGLVIYIRKDVKFDEVKISVGAGTLQIEELETKSLDLSLGAGKTQIDHLVVTSSAKINGGAGKLEIDDAKLHNADVELGVGKSDLQARLTGRSKIEAGVGKLDLDLVGERKDYKLLVDKGIGAVSLDGESLHDGAVHGDGANNIEIKSGVGAVDIRFVGR